MKPILPVILSCSLILAAAPKLYGEIVVKQDKNGNILVTNTGSTGSDRIGIASSKSKTVKYKGSSHSLEVPRKYLDKIRLLSQKYGMKERLVVAVVKAESSFNPRAVSHKGAVGLMQLMKETAKDYGVTDRFDPDQNLDAGIRHLKYLYRKYRRDLPLTLAAYNAGEEAVKKYNGVPPYKETKNYIKRVMKYMGLNYGNLFRSRSARGHIYKYIRSDGKVIITDTLPAKIDGTVTIIE